MTAHRVLTFTSHAARRLGATRLADELLLIAIFGYRATWGPRSESIERPTP